MTDMDISIANEMGLNHQNRLSSLSIVLSKPVNELLLGKPTADCRQGGAEKVRYKYRYKYVMSVEPLMNSVSFSTLQFLVSIQ